MDEVDMQRRLSEVLGLHGTELETMMAVLRHCSQFGLATGGAGAVGGASAGSVTVPVVGAVPGWLIGFAAGFAGGTLVCSLAQRGLVIEALKGFLSAKGETVRSERDALHTLHVTLSKLGPAPNRLRTA